jgi:hypothetical protein
MQEDFQKAKIGCETMTTLGERNIDSYKGFILIFILLTIPGALFVAFNENALSVACGVMIIFLNIIGEMSIFTQMIIDETEKMVKR